MKIGIIGAGRLGICFALLCEQAGYDVLVSDIFVADEFVPFLTVASGVDLSVVFVELEA